MLLRYSSVCYCVTLQWPRAEESDHADKYRLKLRKKNLKEKGGHMVGGIEGWLRLWQVK
jgi:hypothetical protein